MWYTEYGPRVGAVSNVIAHSSMSNVGYQSSSYRHSTKYKWLRHYTDEILAETVSLFIKALELLGLF